MENRDKNQEAVGMEINPPLTFFGTLALGLLVGRAFSVSFLPRKTAMWVGLPLLAAGLAIGGSAITQMRRANTSFRPDEPVNALVTSGPFRYTRNPLYLCMTLVYGGIATMANSFTAMILLPVVVWLIDNKMIRREEAYLENRFGDMYRAYMNRTPRWF